MSSLLDTAAAKGDSLLDPRVIDGSIYLMRHGHTVLDVDKRSDGWLDMPLSDKGRMSVVEAQQYLKTVPLDCIYCPGLLRTCETAAIVASGTMSSPEVEEVDEAATWDLGVLAGTKKALSKPKVRALIDSSDSRPMGGESYNEFRDRFLPWFGKVAKKVVKSGKPVLYVGSGSNMRLIGQEYAGSMDALDLDEGGLAILHSIDGEWHLEVILGEDDAGSQVS